MSTDEILAQRRDKVGRYTLKGFTAPSIAKVLNVDTRTVERDRRYNRVKWIRDFKKQPIEKLLYFLVATNDEILRENWKVLEDTADGKLKLDSTGGINKIVLARLKIMERMGVIDKVPEKVELSGAIGVHQAIVIGANQFELKKKEDEAGV